MPPEPLPWDRKDFFKERKHERSESVGSVARWRDSSHHHRVADFHRWGSAVFRRPPGHGRQGGWHLFSEESGHGNTISRSSDKMLEEDSRPFVSRGEKYGRNGRDNRGFGQREWRGHPWETTNGSVNFSRRPQDVNNDQRSVDEAGTFLSHPHSDFVDGLGTGPRCNRENSVGSMDWKPLKWTRSGSLSSRGSGFSNSSSSRGMGGAHSNEAKAELQPKIATANESHSGEAAACVTSPVPSEDTISRKKPRLNWGEGLAKYEKKKVEGPDVSANKDGPVLSSSNMEPCTYLGASLVDKSPKVSGFSDCASPATPSSVACSSSPGLEDKLFRKTANADNDVSNMIGSPVHGSQDLPQRFSFNLEKLDIGCLNNLSSSIIELIQSDDPSSVDSGLVRSTAMNKLLIWKADISKVLETTESEIDFLENELRSLRSESGNVCPCPAALGSQLVGDNGNSSEEPVGFSDKVTWPEPLKIVSSDVPNAEKMPLSSNLLSICENGKEEDIDSPGTVTSKLVEPLPFGKAVSPCDAWKHDNFSRDVNGVELTATKCLVPCTSRKVDGVSACVGGDTSVEGEDSMSTISGVSLSSSTEDSLYDKIISSNKELAQSSWGVFVKLLPEGCCKIGNIEASCDPCSPAVMRKFAEKKQFARFKERVITLKFKALHHLWKEDMRLLSTRKCRPKSHKKHELSVRTTCIGNQKNRSSNRSRFPFPGNHLSLVPTSEIINVTSKLLSESQVQVRRNSLKMPALILDEKEKMISKFISSNGLVEDPLAIEKERAMVNPWTSEEREIFLEKFAAFGKDFRNIASFLDHKTTADCVEFYYKNHKSDCFEKLKKQDVDKLGKSFSAKTDLVASGKKWNRETNAASLEILSAASVMADGFAFNKKMRAGSFLMGGYGSVKTSRGEDCMRERSSSFDILGDDGENFVTDIFPGTFSSEAVSSCITSSVDPLEGNWDRKFLKVNPACKQPLTPDGTQNVDDGTCSDESCGEMDPTDWTDEEKAAFLQAVSSFGKDFVKIARCIGTRSQEQCKVFFSKARRCLGLDVMHPIPENVGSPATDDANDGGSDTDDACAVEIGSVVGTDKSGTKTDEDLPSSVMNTHHDEMDTVEARNLSVEVNESKEINETEVCHEDANLFSDACATRGEAKLGSGSSEAVLYCSDKSCSVSGQATIMISDGTEVGKDKANKLGRVVMELTSALDTIEPCSNNSGDQVRLVSEVSSGSLGNELTRHRDNKLGRVVMELTSALDTIEPCSNNSGDQVRLVSEVSSGSLGNELARHRVALPQCPDGRDDKHDSDAGVIVELKSSVQDSTNTINASLSSVGNSCSGLSFGAESKHVSLGKTQISALYAEDLHATANSLSQNSGAAVHVLSEKNAVQDQLSSTCDFQGSRNLHYHNPIRNGDHQLHIPGNSLDLVEVLHQGHPMQVPIKKELNGDMKCSSSATGFPLLSQKIEHANDHFKTRLHPSSDSEEQSRNGDVKLFGKILNKPSSAQKHNLSTKGSEENGIHRPKLTSKPSSLKFTSRHNTDENLKILNFDCNDSIDYLGLENVPVRSYGYWDGNRIQTGLSSLPDSAILLAKYPAAFSNYSASSAKFEQQALQAFAKNNERHVNGASAFTTRDINGSNALIDYQMFRSRVGPKVQPFMVDVKHCQDVLSEMQRRNGFEAISSLQQQGRGMVGINGVRRPGILGGSCSGVSDPVAAIKLHYPNSDKYGGQTGYTTREDESWAGKGDFGR